MRIKKSYAQYSILDLYDLENKCAEKMELYAHKNLMIISDDEKILDFPIFNSFHMPSHTDEIFKWTTSTPTQTKYFHRKLQFFMRTI